MMRAFFIVACVLSLVYTISAFAITAYVDDQRSQALWSYDYSTDYYDYSSGYDYSYDNYASEMYDENAEDGTRMGGILSVFFMLISAGVFLMALLKIKTATMKVVSIIGLSLSGLFLLWAMLPMASPGAVSFDEIGAAFGLAGMALLGLNVVGIVHAFKTST